MRNKYHLSIIIICILSICISFIACINEDPQTSFISTIAFTILSFVACLLATPLSKKLINYGNCISSKGKRIFFYIILLPISVALICVIWTIIYFLMNHSSDAETFASALSQAVLVIFLLAAAVIFILVPYVQTLILNYSRLCRESG